MSDLASRNKDLVRRIYEEMWNQSNSDLAAEIFLHPEGVEKFLRQFLPSFSDLQHTVDEMIAEGDRVAARFTARGTHSGPWMDFPATGRAIEYSGVTWCRVANGKIIEHQTWWDKAALIEQVKG
jgi:steroid delta-isomerase-like uncharacterized protein